MNGIRLVGTIQDLVSNCGQAARTQLGLRWKYTDEILGDTLGWPSLS